MQRMDDTLQSLNIEHSFSDLLQELQAQLNPFLESLKNQQTEVGSGKINTAMDSTIYRSDVQGNLARKLAQWVNEVHNPSVAGTAPQLTAQTQLNPALSNHLQFFMRLYRFHQNPTPLQQDLLWLMVAAQPFYAKMLPLFLSSLGADHKKYSEAIADIAFTYFNADYFPLTSSTEVQTAVFKKILTAKNPPYDYLRSRLISMMSPKDAEYYLSTLHYYEMNPDNLETVLEALFCKLGDDDKTIVLANEMKELNSQNHHFDESRLNKALQRNTEFPLKKIAEIKANPAQKLVEIFLLPAEKRHAALLALMEEIHHHIDDLEKKLCAPKSAINQCSIQQLIDAIKTEKEYIHQRDPWPQPVLNARNQLIIPTYCKIAESVTKEQQSQIIKSDYLVRFLQSLILAIAHGEQTKNLRQQIIIMQRLLVKPEDIDKYIKFIVAIFAKDKDKINDLNSPNFDDYQYSNQWLSLLCVLAALQKQVNLTNYLTYNEVCIVLSGWHDFHAMTADHPPTRVALFDNLSIIINILTPAEQKIYLTEQAADKSRSVVWLAAVMKLPLPKEAALCFFDNVTKKQDYIYTYKNLIKYLPACMSAFLKEFPSEFAIQLLQLLKGFRSAEIGYELTSLLTQDPTMEIKPVIDFLIPELLKEIEFPSEKSIKKCEAKIEFLCENRRKKAAEKQQTYQGPSPEEKARMMKKELANEAIFHESGIYIATDMLAIMSPYFSDAQSCLFITLLSNLLSYETFGIHHSYALIKFILSKPQSPLNQQILRMIAPNLLHELAECGTHRHRGTLELISMIYSLLTPAEKDQATSIFVEKFSRSDEYYLNENSIIAQNTIIFLSQRMAEGMSPEHLIRITESIIDQTIKQPASQKDSLAKHTTSVLNYLSSCLEVLPYNANLQLKINELGNRVKQYYFSRGVISVEGIGAVASPLRPQISSSHAVFFQASISSISTGSTLLAPETSVIRSINR
jgi:hypothetical protein